MNDIARLLPHAGDSILIERVVGWYKEYRALGTRYDKLAVNYVALWLLAIIDKLLHSTLAT